MPKYNPLPADLYKFWHPTGNVGLDITAGLKGSDLYWWTGPCGHKWQKSIHKMKEMVKKGSTGCSYCAGTQLLEGFNDLGSQFPDVASEWHPVKNGTLTPSSVTATSTTAVWWKGKPCGHEWDMSITQRTSSGQGCPICAGRRVLEGFNDLASRAPDVASEWHPTKNDGLFPTQVTPGSHKKVWWLGGCGHDWEMPVQNRTSRKPQGCPYCAGRKVWSGSTDLATRNPAVAAEWHPTKNGDLTPAQVTTANARMIWWLGRCGHEWETTVANRTQVNSGCPYCAGKFLQGYNDLESQDAKIAAEWHPTKNGEVTPRQVHSRSKDDAWWVGSCGHEWTASPVNRTLARSGCPYCSSNKLLPGFNDFATRHPDKAALWHPTKNGSSKPQDFSPSTYALMWWKSPTCGHEWRTTISSMSAGTACPVCAGKQVVLGVNDLATVAPHIAAQWHPVLNGHLKPSGFTVGTGVRAWRLCPKDPTHSWISRIADWRYAGCPKCSNSVSKAEKEIATFISTLAPDALTSDRTLLKRLELDIYVPSKGLAVEFNGLYWHSEAQGKGRHYHYDKWKACKAAGVQLIQIWEDEWSRNPEQVKRMLSHKLEVQHTGEKRVMARKSIPVTITKQEASTFLEAYHIQGFAVGSHYLGLRSTDTGETVAVLVLKKEAGTDGKSLNIIRYATSAVVPGGFTKLLTYAERTYSPETFITFSDHCVSDGGLYRNNGFVADKELPPDYMYVVKNERKHKFGYRLKRFKNDPNLKWQPGLTEKELATFNGLHRVWDAGKTRWVKVVQTGNTTSAGSVPP